MMIEGKEAVLHITQFGAPVLSHNGRDCATGEKYVPRKVPGWTWVFTILHAIDFFLLIGWAIGGVILFSGSTRKNTPFRPYNLLY